MRGFGRTRAWAHVIGATMWLVSTLAVAHSGTGSGEQILAGLVHPILGIDHLFTTVGLGLLVTRLDRRVGWQLSAGFFAGMMLGVVARYVGVEWPGTEMWLAFGMCGVGGVLSASPRCAPSTALSVLVSTLALLHGYVHADELAPSIEQWPVALGFLSGSGILLGFGGMLGTLTRGRVLTFDRLVGATCVALGAIAVATSV